MEPSPTLEDVFRQESVGVLGLGRPELNAARLLRRAGARVYVASGAVGGSSRLGPNRLGGLELSEPRDWPLGDLKALVVSPEIPWTGPEAPEVVRQARDLGCPILNDVDVLFSVNPQPGWVGVAGGGGVGPIMTASLIAHMVRKIGFHALDAGDGGHPVCSLPLLDRDGVYCLGLSPPRLRLLERTCFNISVLLNLTPAEHSQIDLIRKVFARQTVKNVAVVCIDSELNRILYEELRPSFPGALIPVSVVDNLSDYGVSLFGEKLYDRIFLSSRREWEVTRIETLSGQAGRQYLAAAYAATRMVGIQSGVMADLPRDFPGIAHRLDQVLTYQGIRYLDDSLSTSIHDTVTALEGFDGRHEIYWIAGGCPAPVRRLPGKIRHVFLEEAISAPFAEALQANAIEYTQADSLEDAFRQAHQRAVEEVGRERQRVVLYSPATGPTPFVSPGDRGEVFRQLAYSLPPEA